MIRPITYLFLAAIQSILLPSAKSDEAKKSIPPEAMQKTLAQPIPFREYSPSRSHYFDAYPAQGGLQSYGRVYSSRDGKPLWVVRGYSAGAVVADDGETLAIYAIHELPLLDGKMPAIAFLKRFESRAELTKAYSLAELVGEKKDGDLPQLSQVLYGKKTEGTELEAVLSDGTRISFDIKSGKLLSRNAGKPIEGALSSAVCAGYVKAETSRVVARRFNLFAGRFFANLPADQDGGNLAISPLDLATNLSLVSLGAAGKTAKEFDALLGQEAGGSPESRELVVKGLNALQDTVGVTDLDTPASQPHRLIEGLTLVSSKGKGVEVKKVAIWSSLNDHLHPGDIIQAVGEQEVSDAAAVESALRNQKAEFTLSITAPGAKEAHKVRVPVGPFLPIQTGTSLWLNQDTNLNPGFDALMKRYRPGYVHRIDLDNLETAAGLVNEDIRRLTKGKVTRLLAPEDLAGKPKMVLASATYLSALWPEPFALLDKPMPFGPDPKQTATMMKGSRSLRVLQANECDLIEVPFAGEKLALILLVPDASMTLSKVSEAVGKGKLSEWLDVLDTSKRRPVELTMPVYEIPATKLSVVKPLARMGLTTAFSPTEADFSALSEDKTLRLSEVIHGAYIRVDEMGIEAAAATATVAVPRSDVDPLKIRVDRPFLFLVREKASGVILFAGRVTLPKLAVKAQHPPK